MTEKGNHLRILYVTGYYKPAYVYGGPVRSTSALCEALVKQGNQVTVYTTNANGAHPFQLSSPNMVNIEGVEVHTFPLSRYHHLFFSLSQINAVVNNVSKYDLVFAQTLWQPLAPIIAFSCHRSRVPYIVPLHGQLLPWSLRHHATRKSFFLKLCGYSYLNHAAALLCTDASEVKALKILDLCVPTMIMPNALNLSSYSSFPNRGEMRDRLGIPPEAPVILFLGRLHPKKRPDIAVQVCAGLHKRYHQKVHLILAGPDESGLLVHLRELADESGVQDYFHFIGLVEDKQLLQVLADSDLLIMPSEGESENFGMSAVEALACGLPVITSDSVPIGRWAEQAGAGRVVPCSAEAFIQVSADMLSDLSNMHKMGEIGRRLVRTEFDSSIIANRMFEQLQAIVKTGKPLLESDTKTNSMLEMHTGG